MYQRNILIDVAAHEIMIRVETDIRYNNFYVLGKILKNHDKVLIYLDKILSRVLQYHGLILRISSQDLERPWQDFVRSRQDLAKDMTGS